MHSCFPSLSLIMGGIRHGGISKVGMPLSSLLALSLIMGGIRHGGRSKVYMHLSY